MIIYLPEIIIKNDSCILQTVFEIDGKKDILWYKIPLEYKDYLVVENLDAALIGLLILAMKKKENIYLKGKVSSKLYYGLSNYLIRAIDLAYPEYESIEIIPDSLSEVVFNNENITSTGVSCGIDSFATIAMHHGLESSYAIKYLTYFNAGSHGVYGGEIANNIYNKRLLKVKDYARKVNLPLVLIESNIMEVIDVNFQSLHTLIHLSCVLSIQKLIRTYYYASSFRFDYYNIYGINSSWDILILKLLETESTNFYSSASQYTRFERTKIVADYEPSYHFLDVCTDAQNSKKINCSKCEKCVRTQLTLELLGKLEAYDSVFEFDVYKKYRDRFISELLTDKNMNQTNKDLYRELRINKQINFRHHVLNIVSSIKRKLYKLKKQIT
ncbi:hypothetical protein Q4Q34_01110 [Flavivirga abyssicola]|uniref:hypothetical protein n=1 Tax=Flavivirga abyssicola TaxID=3063533 RepID=UPI0026DFDE9D|nr:hypothetical protein [Flavivirga sp. MEBiC07777]WVK13637.1 hypothetical protein Q4Q34_01110 [Flavivirga sp. MEBiC07777]